MIEEYFNVNKNDEEIFKPSWQWYQNGGITLEFETKKKEYQILCQNTWISEVIEPKQVFFFFFFSQSMQKYLVFVNF